ATHLEDETSLALLGSHFPAACDYPLGQGLKYIPFKIVWQQRPRRFQNRNGVLTFLPSTKGTKPNDLSIYRLGNERVIVAAHAWLAQGLLKPIYADHKMCVSLRGSVNNVHHCTQVAITVRSNLY